MSIEQSMTRWINSPIPADVAAEAEQRIRERRPDDLDDLLEAVGLAPYVGHDRNRTGHDGPSRQKAVRREPQIGETV